MLSISASLRAIDPSQARNGGARDYPRRQRMKSVLMAVLAAAGLLMLDVAQPVLTGATAQAAPPRRAAPAVRSRPAPRVNVQRSFARPARVARPAMRAMKPKPTFRAARRTMHAKPTPRV